MKQNFRTLLAILISISIFAGYAAPVYAQDETDTLCHQEMKPYIAQKSQEFRTYLTSHFQSKKTNSSLLELALKKFDVYKKDLVTKYATYNPQAGFTVLTETSQTIKCNKIVQDEIALMEKLLRSYFLQTSKVKTTSAMMEKLKAINKRMDELLKAVTMMYGKWKSLKGRIPCFVKNCI
ncbi:hypothetical protein ACFLZH_04335 [Patescibacteria group bacterium]